MLIAFPLTCILQAILRLHNAQIPVGLGCALVIRGTNRFELRCVALHDTLGVRIGQAEALDQRHGVQSHCIKIDVGPY